MRLIIIFISVFISASILMTFFINGQNGIVSISADENPASQTLVPETGEELTKITTVDNVENFNYESNSLPANEDLKNPEEAKPVKIANAEPLSLTARCGVAVASGSNEVLYEQAANEQTSIASISKLATALVFLDINPGWDKIYEIKRLTGLTAGRFIFLAATKSK